MLVAMISLRSFFGSFRDRHKFTGPSNPARPVSSNTAGLPFEYSRQLVAQSQVNVPHPSGKLTRAAVNRLLSFPCPNTHRFTPQYHFGHWLLTPVVSANRHNLPLNQCSMHQRSLSPVSQSLNSQLLTMSDKLRARLLSFRRMIRRYKAVSDSERQKTKQTDVLRLHSGQVQVKKGFTARCMEASAAAAAVCNRQRRGSQGAHSA